MCACTCVRACARVCVCARACVWPCVFSHVFSLVCPCDCMTYIIADHINLSHDRNCVNFLPNMYCYCLQRHRLLRGLWLELAVSWDETDSTRSCRSVWRAAETSSSSTWSESTGRDVSRSTAAGEFGEGANWDISGISQPFLLKLGHGGDGGWWTVWDEPNRSVGAYTPNNRHG